jgi:starvation-inducible DNA-binding protein
MAKTNNIGLDLKKSGELAMELNRLLSAYQVLYMNTRGFHWNIKGNKFFELHVKFEEIYTDLQLRIDEVAERIITIGFTPLHSYHDYLKHSPVKEIRNVTDGTKGLQHILDAYRIIIPLQRGLLDLSAKINDEGTNALMSDYIRAQEKQTWMYAAYLNK